MSGSFKQMDYENLTQYCFTMIKFSLDYYCTLKISNFTFYSSEAGFEVGRKETDCDTELNVDDDDTAEFGPEQFTEADIIPCPSDDSTEDKQRQALRDAVVG